MYHRFGSLLVLDLASDSEKETPITFLTYFFTTVHENNECIIDLDHFWLQTVTVACRKLQKASSDTKRVQIRYDTVRYTTVRYDMIRNGTLRYGTVRYGTIRYGTEGTVRYGTITVPLRYDTVWYDTVRLVDKFDTVWYDTV